MILESGEADTEIVTSFEENGYQCFIAKVSHRKYPLPIWAGYIRIAETVEEIEVSRFKGLDNTYSKIVENLESARLTYSGLVEEEVPEELEGYYLGFDTSEQYNQVPDDLPEDQKKHVLVGAVKDLTQEIEEKNLLEVLKKP